MKMDLWDAANNDIKEYLSYEKIDKKLLNMESLFESDCNFFTENQFDNHGRLYTQEYLECDNDKMREFLLYHSQVEA